MMNCKQSEILFEKSKKVVPGGVHSPVRAFRGVGGTPRFIQSAQGAELLDVDGNRYIDFCMSWGPLIFGHQDPETYEAINSALKRGWSYGAAEPYSLELAELITQSIPWVEKIRFVNSGTEAVMAALRVARAATGRNKILKFDGCYHGHVDSMLVKAGSGLAEMVTPDSAGVPESVASETLIAPLNDLKRVEEIFHAHRNEIAAVIYEGVPANNGLLLQKENFLKDLSALCKSHGSLLILDEVITGFRVAFGGMAERSGIEPDLVTYGKIIGGGFPVGAYGGRAELMNLVAPAGPVYQAGTLSANPIAMAAGLTTVRKLKRESPYASLEKKVEELGSLFKSKPELGVHFQSIGSLFWMVLGQPETSDGMVRTHLEAPASHREKYPKVFHALLDRGIYLAPSAFEVSFISTAHQSSHLHRLIQSVEEIQKEWRSP